MSTVAILGCGPAGLIAAHAVEVSGHEPIIFSRKQKSVIPGSMYLHEPIPGVTDMYPESTVQYMKIGTASGYALKVYSDAERHTGWENYDQTYPSWNVVRAYDKLWARYEDRIRNKEVTQELVAEMVGEWELAHVISTLPMPTLCYGQHTFEGEPYAIQTLRDEDVTTHRDFVIYNGRLEDRWYRYSSLSGIVSIEYAGEYDIPDRDNGEWVQGQKAVRNNCTCYPGLVRVGRWAEWRHGVLLHHAYRKTIETMRGVEAS